jgi:RNA polymerase II-associated factor 1
MRRPDYISTEQTRYQPTTMEKVESKIGYVVRKKMGGDQVRPFHCLSFLM